MLHPACAGTGRDGKKKLRSVPKRTREGGRRYASGGQSAPEGAERLRNIKPFALPYAPVCCAAKKERAQGAGQGRRPGQQQPGAAAIFLLACMITGPPRQGNERWRGGSALAAQRTRGLRRPGLRRATQKLHSTYVRRRAQSAHHPAARRRCCSACRLRPTRPFVPAARRRPACCGHEQHQPIPAPGRQRQPWPRDRGDCAGRFRTRFALKIYQCLPALCAKNGAGLIFVNLCRQARTYSGRLCSSGGLPCPWSSTATNRTPV